MRLLTEIGLVFARQTTLSLRSPAWIIIGLVQPVLYLALFGPLLGTVAEVASFPAGDSWQVFVPGLLVMQSLFSAAFVGFGVIAEQRNGVLERMRVTPVSRLALLLGRCSGTCSCFWPSPWSCSPRPSPSDCAPPYRGC